MRLLRRIFSWLGLLILAIVLFVIGSIAVDALIGGQRVDALSNLTIDGPDDTSISAHIARPADGEPKPAVIMLHDWRGMSADVNSKADDLAAQGYVVVAPDTYRGAVSSWFPRTMYLAISTPTERVNTDLDAVYAWLEAQPDVDADRIAVMGFCYGGGKSLEYGLHNSNLAATVVFYGTLLTDAARLTSMAGPVLGIFGELDAQIPVDEVNAFEAALNEAGVQNQVTIYEERGHGFVKNVESIASDPQQRAAWDELIAFFKDNL